MKYKSFPGTDIEVSQIGLGTWVFSNDVWGQIKPSAMKEVLDKAQDLGVTLIDTAPVYGWGSAEVYLGDALEGRRQDFVLASKCGLRRAGSRIVHDLSAKFIIEDLEGSLQRLKTDYIDLYFCHWPDSKVPLDETLKCLERLQASGKIRFIGISNFNENEFTETVKLSTSKIACYQGHYSLLSREPEKHILPLCESSEIGFMAYGILGGGILSGKYAKNPHFPKNDVRNFFYKYYTRENFSKTHDFLEQMHELRKPLNQVALNWVLSHTAVTTALVGCRSPEQLELNATACDWQLEEKEIKFLNGLCYESV